MSAQKMFKSRQKNVSVIKFVLCLNHKQLKDNLDQSLSSEEQKQFFEMFLGYTGQ